MLGKLLVGGLVDMVTGGNSIARKILTANEVTPFAKMKVADFTYGDGDGDFDWDDVTTVVETVGENIGDVVSGFFDLFG